MAKPIEPDDLEVGMNITILEWHEQERDEYGGMFGTVVTGTRKFRDNSWVGDVLKIVAIDLPFIVVTILSRRYSTALDTRRLRLARISDEYVKAMNVRRG